MEYVAIGFLAVLVIGGGFAALTMRATRGNTPASPETGDPTPLGDTSQHSSETEAKPVAEGGRPREEPEGGRFKRDPIGGEGEGETTIDAGDVPRAG